MATTITRTNMIDDDGSGTTGTVLNNAWKQELYSQIDTALVGVDAATHKFIQDASTGALGIWTIPITGNTTIMWSGSADVTLDGLNNTGVVDGTTVRILGYGGGGAKMLFRHFVSSASNNFFNLVTSGSTPVAYGGSITYCFGGGIWRLVQHEQGAYISVPYSAANFTAGGGTWTVEAGDVAYYLYHLASPMLFVAVALNTTSTGGSPGPLLVTLPQGWTANQQFPLTGILHDGTTQSSPNVITQGGQLAFYPAFYGGAFPVVTNALALRTSGSFPLV